MSDLDDANSLVYRRGCLRGRSWLTMKVGDVWTPGIYIGLPAARLACKMANERFHPRQFVAKKAKGRKYLIERIG